MPLINFTVFTDKILSGEKTQTIRRQRKQKIKQGDKLYLYTGLRTKDCKKLIEATVTDIQDVYISKSQLSTDFMGHIKVGEKLLNNDEMEKLANDDGFNTLKDFSDFFENHYGLPFNGVVIKWLPNALVKGAHEELEQRAEL